MSLSEFKDRASIQTTCGRKIQIFETGRHGKGCLFHLSVKTAILTAGTFEVHEQRQAFFKSWTEREHGPHGKRG